MATFSNLESPKRKLALIPNSSLSEAQFARLITIYLKKENYEHYETKDEKKVRFDKNILQFMRKNKINLTHYPSNLKLPEVVKKHLIKRSKDNPVKGAIATNYKTLIKYIWDEQNRLDSTSSMATDQSQFSKSRIKILGTDQKIQIKTDWDNLNKRLVVKGFLNKKGRPSSVARLTALSVPEIIKYFNGIIHGFLSYYRCSDAFNRDKKRLHWVFKYSLVSTIKMKLKLGSRVKVFDRYGSDISCLDKNNNKVSFLSTEVVSRLKKDYLTDNLPEDINKLMNNTWIDTQNTDFNLDSCVIKGCTNGSIQMYHVSNLYRNISNGYVTIKGRRKELKDWAAIFSDLTVKQLFLCGIHDKMLHNNMLHTDMLDKELIDKIYILNS